MRNQFSHQRNNALLDYLYLNQFGLLGAIRECTNQGPAGGGAAQVPPDWGRSTLHTLTEGGEVEYVIKSIPAPPPILETFPLPKEGYRVFMVFNPMVANQNA